MQPFEQSARTAARPISPKCLCGTSRLEFVQCGRSHRLPWVTKGLFSSRKLWPFTRANGNQPWTRKPLYVDNYAGQRRKAIVVTPRHDPAQSIIDRAGAAPAHLFRERAISQRFPILSKCDKEGVYEQRNFFAISLAVSRLRHCRGHLH